MSLNGDNLHVEVVNGAEATTRAVLEFTKRAIEDGGELAVCGDEKLPSISLQFELFRSSFIETKDAGARIRFVISITESNLKYAKELAQLAELRHLDGVKGSFAVSKNEYIAAMELNEASPVPQAIRSNSLALINHQKHIFEVLWQKAIPATQKIREIEEGVKSPTIEVILIAGEAEQRYHELINSADEEVLLILPTVNAFRREMKIGIMKSLADFVQERGIKVRLFLPRNDEINQDISDLEEKGVTIKLHQAANRDIFTLLIVDRKYALTIEAKDDSSLDFEKAVGMAAFSNSKPTVEPLVAVFESLWRQTDLYRQLEKANNELMYSTEELRMAFDSLADMNSKIMKANQELKVHDKMQKEFISIAAHELRTPVQPLLGVADILASQVEEGDKDKVEISKSEIEMIMRNAKRLERLSSDILEVSKIESHSLKLYKETFDLNQKIKDVIADVFSFIPKNEDNQKKLDIIFQPSIDGVLVDADKVRIFQVISNILRNAIKFTDEGTITVSSEKSNDGKYAIVRIKDTGRGIDPEIYPRLFTKFGVSLAKPYDMGSGTGLGLFISKSIVEAHGGKIWAENNSDGRGATFTFTLGLYKPI